MRVTYVSNNIPAENYLIPQLTTENKQLKRKNDDLQKEIRDQDVMKNEIELLKQEINSLKSALNESSELQQRYDAVLKEKNDNQEEIINIIGEGYDVF